MTANNDILNAQEAAAMLGAHVETVRRLARKGGIPAFKIGKDWRFRKDALLNWSQPKQHVSHNATVLIIENAPGNHLRVSPHLEEAGYRVVRVTDGSEALSLIRKDAIDLVFLDLNLSPTQGAELIRVLRLTYPQLPIVVTSDGEDNHLLNAAFQHGPLVWVPKPIEKETLLAAVRMTQAGSLAEQKVP